MIIPYATWIFIFKPNFIFLMFAFLLLKKDSQIGCAWSLAKPSSVPEWDNFKESRRDCWSYSLLETSMLEIQGKERFSVFQFFWVAFMYILKCHSELEMAPEFPFDKTPIWFSQLFFLNSTTRLWGSLLSSLQTFYRQYFLIY